MSGYWARWHCKSFRHDRQSAKSLVIRRCRRFGCCCCSPQWSCRRRSRGFGWWGCLGWDRCGCKVGLGFVPASPKQAKPLLQRRRWAKAYGLRGGALYFHKVKQLIIRIKDLLNRIKVASLIVSSPQRVKPQIHKKEKKVEKSWLKTTKSRKSSFLSMANPSPRTLAAGCCPCPKAQNPRLALAEKRGWLAFLLDWPH